MLRKGGLFPYPEELAGQSLDMSLSEAARTVTLTGTSDPLVSVNMHQIQIANQGVVFSGRALTPQSDGSFLVNRNVRWFDVSVIAVSRYASNAIITLGVGIGDPSDLPALPGTNLNDAYVSRFRNVKRGEGVTRRATLITSASPVGKTRELGAAIGDYIFPVMWTEESSDTDVIFDDFIFSVTAIL